MTDSNTQTVDELEESVADLEATEPKVRLSPDEHERLSIERAGGFEIEADDVITIDGFTGLTGATVNITLRDKHTDAVVLEKKGQVTGDGTPTTFYFLDNDCHNAPKGILYYKVTATRDGVVTSLTSGICRFKPQPRTLMIERCEYRITRLCQKTLIVDQAKVSVDERHFDHAGEVFCGLLKPREDASAFLEPAD